ncbi:transposase [Myxococcus sp. RHST-1-4]|nr:transposase [Myxococcus sp. RHSTA-1-4]
MKGREDVPYTEQFKEQMVRRMMGPEALSATALGKQVGVPQSTLSKWLKRATLGAMTSESEQQPEAAKVARKWTGPEKLRVLAAAEGLSGEALGALLRREGLHEAQLTAWRGAATGALAEAPAAGGMTAGERRRLAAAEKRVRELEKELRRKEKALAETAALLVLEKLQELGWDERERDEDDASLERSEK